MRLSAGTKPRTSHRRLPGGERRGNKFSTIFLERTREGHRQQASVGTVLKAKLAKLLRDGVVRIWAFPRA